MGLLSGLEKFGINLKGDIDITDEKNTFEEKPVVKEEIPVPVKKIDEKDLVLEKRVQCPICDAKFPVLAVKASRLRRLEPDEDLRPNFEGIDTLKYDVYSCPECGYSSMSKDFEHISTTQMKWIREAVCNNFSPTSMEKKEIYTYDEAVDHYKLALVCAIAKKSKLSEKSLICLRIAWLRRSQLMEMVHDLPGATKKIDAYKEEMRGFYKQAYEGFQKALSTETPPYCGMNSNTVEYLIAVMAFFFRDYPTASRLVSSLLVNTNTPARVKDKCHDLKDKIISEVKAQREAEGKKGE